MKYLPPLILRDDDFDPIQQEIDRLFFLLMYKPLSAVLREEYPELQNSRNALVDAMKKGAVWYSDGRFYGTFSSSVSKELKKIGARYSGFSKSWKLAQANMPVDLKFAQVQAESRYMAVKDSLLRVLDGMDVDTIDHSSETKKRYMHTLTQMELQFDRTLTAAEAIAIPARMTEAQKKVVSDEWGTNLDLYIKGWAKENILKLRQEIQAGVLPGGRAEHFVDMLQDNYGVSKDKAKFLARQETSLLMSKFRETRYRDLGSEEYKWGGANDARERPDHVALNGTIQRWDSKPITNRKTGARNHPGEDYNCRCVAIALIR